MAVNGFIGLSYFVNEYFSQSEDLAANRMNRMTGANGGLKAITFVTFVGLAYIPWLIIPFDRMLFFLLAFQLICMLLFSLPISRMKNIPIISSLLICIYEYLVPFVLIDYALRWYGGLDILMRNTWLIWMWLFIVGLRHILIEEIKAITFSECKRIRRTVELLGIKITEGVFICILIIEAILFCLAIIVLFNYSIQAFILIGGFLSISGITLFNCFKTNEKKLFPVE